MKKISIFKQLLLPMIAIVCALAVCLTGVITVIFMNSYEGEIYGRSQDKSQLVSGDIATFLDGAYGVTEELSVNPSILTMETEVQTPILEDCVKRNPYLELLYIQGKDGMQTGRSSGELADRSTRWWFIQTMEALVEEMYQCDQAVVGAVEQIRHISANAAELTEEVADSLEEQLNGIRSVAKRVDDCQWFLWRWSRR